MEETLVVAFSLGAKFWAEHVLFLLKSRPSLVWWTISTNGWSEPAELFQATCVNNAYIIYMKVHGDW